MSRQPITSLFAEELWLAKDNLIPNIARNYTKKDKGSLGLCLWCAGITNSLSIYTTVYIGKVNRQTHLKAFLFNHLITKKKKSTNPLLLGVWDWTTAPQRWLPFKLALLMVWWPWNISWVQNLTPQCPWSSDHWMDWLSDENRVVRILGVHVVMVLVLLAYGPDKGSKWACTIARYLHWYIIFAAAPSSWIDREFGSNDTNRSLVTYIKNAP